MTVAMPHSQHNAAERAKSIMRGFMSVLERTSRVFTQDDTRVLYADSGQHNFPSYTDGTDVYLNFDVLGAPKTRQDVVRIVGATIHEVCHILYSPRMNNGTIRNDFSDAWNRAFTSNIDTPVVTMGDCRMLWNILEDQRIESIFVAKYPSTAGYFIAMFQAYVAKPSSDLSKAWVFTAGRKFLPVSVRRAIRKAWRLKADPAVVERLVLEYRSINPLASPAGRRRSFDIVMELAKLVGGKVQDPPCRDVDTNDSGRPTNPGTSNKDQDALEDWDDERDDQESQAGSGKSDSEDETDSDADGSGDGGQDDSDDDADDAEDGSGSGKSDEADDTGSGEDSDSDGAGGDDQADGDASADTDSAEGGQQGGRGDGPPMDKDAILDALDEAIESDKDFQEEVKRIQDASRNTRRTTSLIPKERNSFNFGSDPDSKQASISTSMLFKRLASRLDPNWVDDENSGMLDWRKAARKDPPHNGMFKQWDQGVDDAGDIAAVVLLDRSSSMRGQERRAAAAAWTIKRSIELSGGKCAIITFSYKPTLVMDFNQRAGSEVIAPYPSGGTYLHNGMEEAVERLTPMRARHKWVFIVTDGYFNDGPDTIQTDVQSLHDHGIRVACFGYGMDALWLDAYSNLGWDHVKPIAQWSDFSEGVKGVIAASIKSVSRYGRR